MSDVDKSILGNTLNSIVDGRTMLSELMERKHGYQSEKIADPAIPPTPSIDNTEISALRSQLTETARTNGELQGRFQQLERNNAAMTQWIQNYTTQQTQSQTQAKQPSIIEQVEDPILAAALNALEQKNERELQAIKHEVRQESFQRSARGEMQSIQAAVNQVRIEYPEWAQHVTDEKISEFVQPFLNDSNRHGNVNWANEFRWNARQFKYPELETKVTALERELEQYKNKEKREKDSARRDLDKVPSAAGGQRSGATDSGQSAGDRILNQYRAKHGRRASMPWDQFGSALFSELAKEG